MKDILRKARAEGREQVETDEGFWVLHWVDRRVRGERYSVPARTWVFVPKS